MLLKGHDSNLKDRNRYQFLTDVQMYSNQIITNGSQNSLLKMREDIYVFKKKKPTLTFKSTVRITWQNLKVCYNS